MPLLKRHLQKLQKGLSKMALVTSINKAEFDSKELAKRAGEKPESKSEEKAEKKPEVHMGKWMKKYDENEDKNYHSENVIRLANLVGHVPHHEEAMAIHERHQDRGYLDQKDAEKRQKIHAEHWPTAQKMHAEWQSKQK